MPWSEIVLGALTIVTGFGGSVLGYRQAAKVYKLQEKSAEGEAYERAVRIYEKAIDLQSKELDTSRQARVIIEARLGVLEEDLSNARIRIGDLEQFILHQGLTPPPIGPFRG